MIIQQSRRLRPTALWLQQAVQRPKPIRPFEFPVPFQTVHQRIQIFQGRHVVFVQHLVDCIELFFGSARVCDLANGPFDEPAVLGTGLGEPDFAMPCDVICRSHEGPRHGRVRQHQITGRSLEGEHLLVTLMTCELQGRTVYHSTWGV